MGRSWEVTRPMMEGTGDLEAALALASERTSIKMWTHLAQRQVRSVSWVLAVVVVVVVVVIVNISGRLLWFAALACHSWPVSAASEAPSRSVNAAVNRTTTAPPTMAPRTTTQARPRKLPDSCSCHGCEGFFFSFLQPPPPPSLSLSPFLPFIPTVKV